MSGGAASYTYSPLPVGADDLSSQQQVTSDHALARAIAERDAATIRENEAVAAANRSAQRAMNAPHYRDPPGYYYGTWREQRPVVVYRNHADEAFLCFFLFFLFFILFFVIIIIIIAVYADEDDSTTRRLASMTEAGDMLWGVANGAAMRASGALALLVEDNLK